MHPHGPHSSHWVGWSSWVWSKAQEAVSRATLLASHRPGHQFLFPPSPAAPKHGNIQRTGALGELPDPPAHAPHPSSHLAQTDPQPCISGSGCTCRKPQPLGGSNSGLKVRRWRWLRLRCSRCGVELLLPVWPGVYFLLTLQEETGWTCWKPTLVLIDQLSSPDLPVASR